MQRITMLDFTNIGTITLVVQVLLPLVVGLVTKMSHPASLKAVLLIVLTAANQFFLAWLAAGESFDWKGYLVNAIAGLVISIAMHFGVWKPLGATTVTQNSLVKDNAQRVA